MGATPIPMIPPPEPSFEERLRAELIPGRDYGELLSLALVAAVMTLVLLPIVWWMA